MTRNPALVRAATLTPAEPVIQHVLELSLRYPQAQFKSLLHSEPVLGFRTLAEPSDKFPNGLIAAEALIRTYSIARLIMKFPYRVMKTRGPIQHFILPKSQSVLLAQG